MITFIERRVLILIIIGFLVFVYSLFFQNAFMEYISTDYLYIHKVLDLFTISIALAIFVYGWLTLRHTNETVPFLITNGFLAVAIFEVIHTLSYKGVSFDEGFQTTVWLGALVCLTELLVLTIGIYFLKKIESVQAPSMKYIWVAITVIWTIILSVFIVQSSNTLPFLVTEELKPTFLKNIIEITSVCMYLGFLLYFFNRYSEKKNIIYLDLLLACCFMIYGSLTVLTFRTIYEIAITAQAFKVIGYFFIMKAFYYWHIQKSIADKEETEQKLLHVENELESLFKYTPDAIVIFDRESQLILRSNPSFRKMFGFKRNHSLYLETIIPKTAGDIKTKLEALKPGRSYTNYHTQLQCKDGKLIPVSVTISPIKAVDSEKNNRFYAAIIRDETEKKQAESAIQNVRRELQEAIEQHQGAIFKVKKVNGSFVYTLVDGQMLRKYYFVPTDVVGKTPGELFPMEKAVKLEEKYEQAWQGNQLTFQSDLLSDITILISLNPKIENGKTVELIGSFIDITTLIKTEELLRKSEKLSVVGELAAGFAHEIRNPLTTIKGFLQLLETTAEIKNKSYLSIMLQEIEHLEMITNEFMVVAKPQAIQFQKEDLGEVLATVSNFLHPQALLKDVEMYIEKPEYPIHIFIDKNQLRQVFINLYKNAMEAMPEGGVIITRVLLVGSEVSIAITDEGIGIPEEIIDRLGEPFYTLKEKGTGLGLMVSKKIIEAHQGTLEITSKVNVGTTMTLNIPLAIDEDKKYQPSY
ncbi:MASE3 domain-containing protein [Bacillus solitudinis]|uniref:MASE3 domain-containing protein n=1 Tax=Bacillus solitudinis TaxID=2014074 RepID=UPI000C24B4E9|nr:MASE3 domain-containing protein [Bacillus solitudinis]